MMKPTLINGRWELLLPEHRAVRPQWETGWEPERLASMFANIHGGDIVYDVGAEEGDLSALFATWAAPIGGVVLFEPNPKVWPNIRAIWEANALPKPLAWWVGFAGDHDRGVDVLSYDRGWPGCSLGPVIGDHGFLNLSERPDVSCVRIDTLAKGWPPDVISIDIEGAELRCLYGAVETLRERKPLVYVSVHPTFMQEMYGVSDKELHDLMADLGYEGTHLATDHEEHWAFAHPDGRRLVG